jgi:hypothetical protein
MGMLVMMAHSALKIDPPYFEVLDGILAFSSLAEAEGTLFRLERLRRNYLLSNDSKGMEYCRQIAMLGRRRAEFISHNKRVSMSKRRQKREIASWFRIWLETPALFETWLALRKETGEFNDLLHSEMSEE